MPDSVGWMTEEEKAKALQWLKDHRKGPCPFCGHHELTMANVMGAMLVIADNGARFNNLVPSVILNCTNCGHTQLFNALMMGVLSPSNLTKGEKKDG